MARDDAGWKNRWKAGPDGRLWAVLLDNYLRTFAWALPTIVVGLALLCALAPTVQRRTGLPRWLTVLFGFSVVGFVALVVTPGRDVLDAEGRGQFDAAVRIPTLRDLYVFTELGLNIWLAVPMGFFATLVALRLGSHWPWLLVLSVPILAETWQWAIPQWGRVGFQLSDALANLTGIAVGCLVGWASARWVGARRVGARRRGGPAVG